MPPALTAVSAVIGPIIPPSIPMVLYALVADASIGYLFLGGVIPGLLMALAQMGINRWMAHRHGFPVAERVPLREFPRLTLQAVPALLMPVILLGGIYGGVDDADRGRRGRRRLCLVHRRSVLSQPHPPPA